MGKDIDQGLYDFDKKENEVYLTANQVVVLLCRHYPHHNNIKDKVVDLRNVGYVIRCSSEVYNEVKGYYNNFESFMDAMGAYSEVDISYILQDQNRIIWPSTDFLINRITDKQPSESYIEEKLRRLEKLKSGLQPSPKT